MIKTLQSNKKLISVGVVLLLVILFGLIRPALNVTSTSYLFGLIEKQPNAKGLVKEYFKEESESSRDGKVYRPFGPLMSLDSNFDPNFDRSNFTYSELETMQYNATNWDYERISRVVNKLELVKCEKEIVFNTNGYVCKFLLTDLSGTGLYEKMIQGNTLHFEALIMNDNGNYKVRRFYD
jgi:hypothetical protein